MTIQWGNSMYAEYGNALGYATHQKMLRAALERNGVKIVEERTPGVDVVVHIVTPEMFMPAPGKFNVLYTMYECTTIPPRWVEPIQYADLIVVPCQQNKVLFGGYTDVPIVVCNEGVDTELYSFVARDPGQLVSGELEMFRKSGKSVTRKVSWRILPKKRPFVFYWVGASNPRKGYEHLVAAWHVWNKKHPELADYTMLYMKTTQSGEKEHVIGFKDGKPIFEKMPRERVFKAGNATVDTRKLPFEELRDQYQKAHAFVFPTMGEGFGLTLAEAMSTGLPVIYTPWSGPVDFCSPKEGYPLKYKFSGITTAEVLPDGSKRPVWQSTAANPDVMDIVRQMERVYFGYEAALKRGQAAAMRIRSGFTWDISAQNFKLIIAEAIGERAA